MIHRRTLALAFAAALLAAPAARAQFVTSPFGPGPGYGFGLPGSPFGSYGGYGYGGYGYGGYGYGGDGFGMTAYSIAASRQAQYEMMQQEANLRNAQAAQAYQQARLTANQADGAYLDNLRNYDETRAKLEERLGQDKTTLATQSEEAKKQLARYVDPEGKVIWPSFAPNLTSRAPAEAKVKDVVAEVTSRGEARIKSVTAAKRTVYDYGKAALANLRKEPAEYREMRDFLNGLEGVLNSLAY